MNLNGVQKRINSLEEQAINLVIERALVRAREAPRAQFAATLMALLPGDATHVQCDFDLLTNDELEVLTHLEP